MKKYLLLFLTFLLLSACGSSGQPSGGITLTISEYVFNSFDRLTIRYNWINSSSSSKTVHFDTQVTFVDNSSVILNEVEIWAPGSGIYEKTTGYKSTTSGGISKVEIVGVSGT